MAHKKGLGSSKNGRDSNAQRLGVKVFGGQAILGGAKVTAQVLGEGRGEKILVFKLKRKKQYKKMQGHRQGFVEVKINEILVNGKSFKG